MGAVGLMPPRPKRAEVERGFQLWREDIEKHLAEVLAERDRLRQELDEAEGYAQAMVTAHRLSEENRIETLVRADIAESERARAMTLVEHYHEILPVWQKRANRYADRLGAAEGRVAELMPYVKHQLACEYSMGEKNACICGLDALLRPAEPAVRREENAR